MRYMPFYTPVLFFILSGVGLSVQSSSAIAAPMVTSTINGITSPTCMGVNSSTNRIYVGNYYGWIIVIDGATNTVTSTMKVAEGASAGNGIYPGGMGVNSSTNRIYVTNNGQGSSGRIIVIDGATNTVISTISVGSHPWRVGVNSSTNRIYVANYYDNTVSVIDGATNTVISTISVGGSPRGIGVNSSTNRIYVPHTLNGKTTVSVIDGDTDTVTSTISVVGVYPDDVGVNSSTNRIYMANYDDNTVNVIDGTTNTVTSTISVGSKPMGVGVDSSTNRIYVTNTLDDTVSVIDGATNTVTSTISVGDYPYYVEVNSSTNRIYVTNYNSSTVSVIEDSTITTSPTPTSYVSPTPTPKASPTPATTCTLLISSTTQSFASSGGSGSVSVTASSSSCSWTATSNTSWITITSGSSVTGNGTVNYSVASNSNTSSRTGTMSIAGQTFTVTQSAQTILPTVTTETYQVTSSSSAYLFGTVNPNGLSTTGWFEWGETSSYGNTTNAESLGSGIGLVQMLHSISGLSASTTYHFRAVAQNSAGTSYGDDMTFTMPDAVATVPPFVTTNAATSISSSSATLNGTVNPNGASTTGWFEWGTSASYGNTTQTFSGGSGTSDVAMSWTLSSLSPKTTYHFRAVGQNSAGTSYGSDMYFTTSSSGAQPTVKTGTATDVTSSAATLNGTVNANGLSTTAEFVYRLNGSYSKSWRTSRQTVSGSSDTSVSINISGLSPGASYYYRIEGENSTGRSYGKGSTFTTLKDSVTPKPSPTPTPKTDTTAPSGSININSGASYAKSTTVTIALSATDSVGVTGYYLSTSSSTPVATASGWNSVTPTTSYSGRASYSLSSGDGNKTIYAWYKDSAGNVSKSVNDSIVLDTTAPVVTITNPTVNSNYTATGSAINLGGSASDSTSGVISVTWSNNTGGSGKASGTTNWSVSNVGLSNGENTITVTATDNAGNSGTDTLLVTYSASSEEESLLEKYAPVLYMHPDERFYPINAEVMLANSNLYKKEDDAYTSVYDSALTSLDYLMNNYDDSTYYLKLKDDWDEGKDEDFWKSSPTIYGRQFDNGGYTVLQYWFFYIYNDWDDIHEGDWEMIQIILKENDETKMIEPKMITYSIHLGGKTFLWNDSRVRKVKNHPLVYVTLGGHGSWNKAGDNVWFQGYGACLECTDETSSIGDVLVPSTISVTSDEYKKYQLEDLSKVLTDHWIYWQGHWGDINVKEGIQKLKLPMTVTGPSSPPYIDYISKVKKNKKIENGRWYKPIAWAKKPKPSYYTICASVNTKVTVYEFDTNIANVSVEHCLDLNTCGNCPNITFVYSEKDLVFDVYSLDGNEVDLRISRHKRTGNVCEAEFNGMEISKKGKASFTFSPEQNPTLEIGIDHNRDGIFDSYRLPDFLEVNK